MSRTRKLFTADEDALILAMIAEGKDYSEIACALGRRLSSAGNRGRLLLGKASSSQESRRRREERKASAEKVIPAEKRVLAGDECRCLGGCGKTFHSPCLLYTSRCV